MALKQNEKTLVGVALLAGGIGLFVAVGMPQFDAYSTNNTQVTTLNEEITGLKTQKDNLTAQIALLERNTDIPPGVNIKTYTPENKEEVIKELLDQVVGLATGAGNKFISLKPAEVTPLVAPPEEQKEDDKTKAAEAKAVTDPAAGTATTQPEGEAAALPPPLLNTFGYEMAVRGSYDTVHNFLKAMTEQKELLEISGINIAYESMASGTSGSDSKVLDPNYPIKLTATIRLALQPISP